MSVSVENRVMERFYITPDEVASLSVDKPLRHDSPQNMNYMAAYAIPVVNYLKEKQPHVAIGCDRAGRMFSRAVYAMWYELMDGEPFPTLDNRLHFAYISVKQSEKDPANKEKMRRRVNEIIAASKEAGEKHGQGLSEHDRLRVLFIDDFMNNGRVRALASDLLDGKDAEIDFAVMWRDKREDAQADVYGTDGGIAKMGRTGLDMPLHLGFDYADVDRPVLASSDASVDNFRRLRAAVKKVAGIVRITE